MISPRVHSDLAPDRVEALLDALRGHAAAKLRPERSRRCPALDTEAELG